MVPGLGNSSDSLSALAFFLYISGKRPHIEETGEDHVSYKEEDCPRYAMRWGGCPFLFDKGHDVSCEIYEL